VIQTVRALGQNPLYFSKFAASRGWGSGPLPVSAGGCGDAPRRARDALKDRDQGWVYFSEWISGVFPGWGFVFLKSQAAKNSPLLARPRYPGEKPAQAACGADLQSCSSSSGSVAAACFHLCELPPVLGYLKQLFLPLLHLKKHLMGRTGGFFFLADTTIWPQTAPGSGILDQI